MDLDTEGPDDIGALVVCLARGKRALDPLSQRGGPLSARLRYIHRSLLVVLFVVGLYLLLKLPLRLSLLLRRL